MSVSLTSNFLANARGLTFQDANGITWAINPNTNAVTASYTGTGSAGANPAAKVGTAAVNGSAATFMRSDAAPPVDQTISPTWTGNHTFKATSGASMQVTGNGAGVAASVITDTGNPNGACIQLQGNGATTPNKTIRSTGGNLQIVNSAYNAVIVTISDTGAIGINGVTSPPAKVTGWGTPTGASVQSNFSGAAATLPQCSAAIAKIITDLKALGLYGA